MNMESYANNQNEGPAGQKDKVSDEKPNHPYYRKLCIDKFEALTCACEKIPTLKSFKGFVRQTSNFKEKVFGINL